MSRAALWTALLWMFRFIRSHNGRHHRNVSQTQNALLRKRQYESLIYAFAIHKLIRHQFSEDVILKHLGLKK